MIWHPFSFVDWYQVTLFPASRHFFSLKQVISYLCLLSFLYTFRNSDATPLGCATFLDFMRFSTSTTAFSNTFSQSLYLFQQSTLRLFSAFSSFTSYSCYTSILSPDSLLYFHLYHEYMAFKQYLCCFSCFVAIPNKHFDASDLLHSI